MNRSIGATVALDKLENEGVRRLVKVGKNRVMTSEKKAYQIYLAPQEQFIFECLRRASGVSRAGLFDQILKSVLPEWLAAFESQCSPEGLKALKKLKKEIEMEISG